MLDLTSTNDGYYEYHVEGCSTHGSADIPRDIAAIVTTHNSAAFLHECMQSIMAQTLQPEQIVIVDDCSTNDNTLAVARAYEQHGVKVLQTPKNLGMCGARIHGLQQTNSPVVMFFDGDDVMPPDALMTMRRELGPHSFVYPGRTMFEGDVTNITAHRPAPPACRKKLWTNNYCPSPSLMWRHTYEAAGGWQKPNDEGTLPDWDLFLRMSGRGTFAPSVIDMLVRRHDNNYSRKPWSRPLAEIYGDTRVHAATVSVGIVYSGRLKEEGLSLVLQHLANSLAIAGKEAELIIIDDSRDGLAEVIISAPCQFSSIKSDRIHRDRSAKLSPHEVSRMLASAYNRLLDISTGDLLWMVEDDMLVPANAAKDLIDTIMRSPDSPKAAACGCYRSRHHPERFILATSDGKTVTHAKTLPQSPTPVRLTGTGCLMVLKDMLGDIRFSPQWRSGSIVSNAHDWTFSDQLWQANMAIQALPQVVCPHLQTATSFV